VWLGKDFNVFLGFRATMGAILRREGTSLFSINRQRRRRHIRRRRAVVMKSTSLTIFIQLEDVPVTPLLSGRDSYRSLSNNYKRRIIKLIFV